MTGQFANSIPSFVRMAQADESLTCFIFRFLKRPQEAERRRRAAELALVELQKKLKDGEVLLSGIRDQYNELYAMNKDLDLAIEKKREILRDEPEPDNSPAPEMSTK